MTIKKIIREGRLWVAPEETVFGKVTLRGMIQAWTMIGKNQHTRRLWMTQEETMVGKINIEEDYGWHNKRL